MKKKIIITVLFAIIFIGIGIYLILMNADETQTITEYEPQEEISDEQLRKTIVSLYYKKKDAGDIVAEGKLIDVKVLVNEPYKTLFEMLMEEPKNNNLESVIPKDTKINKIELKDDVLFLDLSEEFINNHSGGEENERATIKSIVNTLCQLTEVNGIKILINGSENGKFNDEKIGFEEVFTIKD